MKYYIVAGEASGDLHSSNLIRELKKKDNNAQFRCWGGDLMKNQGATLVKHYRDLAFMGFTEVLMNINTIIKNLKSCKTDILKFKPDVLILVDYPGFNLRIAKFAKENNIKVFYYISPQIWAWKESRIHHIKKYVDRMFVILPFEKAFYEKYQFTVDFVGHPLLDALNENHKMEEDVDVFSSKEIKKPIIALLPGSRKQEIKTMLPLMLKMQKYFSEYHFIVAAAPSIPLNYYKSLIGDLPVSIVQAKTYALLSKAKAALVTSGTATLEAALLKVPEIVCYKGGRLSYQIAKKLVKVKYISLVNLIMDREVVKELIQNELTENNIKQELNKLLHNTSYIQQINEQYQLLQQKLGGEGASERVAQLMYSYLKK